MAFVPSANIGEARVICLLDGQITNNILHFAFDSPPITSGDIAALAAAVDTWFGSSVLTLLSASLQYLRTETRDLTSQAGDRGAANSMAGEGSAGGDVCPNNVAPCISFQTIQGGRSGRGRFYLPGIPKAVTTASHLQTSFMNDLGIAFNDLLPGNDLAPPGWTWVVLSKTTGGAPRPGGVGYPVTLAYFTDGIVDSQRRRLPGRGK